MILTSCARIVYIGKRIDPEIILDNKHHYITFVNLFDYTSPVNVKKSNQLSYHHGVMGFSEGLGSFANDTSFTYLVGDTLKKGIENGTLTELLPTDSVSVLCRRNKSNMLLALDSVSIFIDQDTVSNFYYGREYMSIDFYLNTRYFLSLYSEEGELINRSEIDRSSMFKPRTSMSGYIILVPSISRSKEDIGNLGFQSGQDYVAKFYPQIVHDTQQLFTGKPFKESNDYIFAKDWNKAIELLEQLVTNPDPVIAEKARHNLEVAKEASETSRR